MLKFSSSNSMARADRFDKSGTSVEKIKKETGCISVDFCKISEQDGGLKKHKEPARYVYALAAAIKGNGEGPGTDSLGSESLEGDIITYNNSSYKILLEEPVLSNISHGLINSFGKPAYVFLLKVKSNHGETGNERYKICDSYKVDM